jgi:hypothetical protein
MNSYSISSCLHPLGEFRYSTHQFNVNAKVNLVIGKGGVDYTRFLGTVHHSVSRYMTAIIVSN